MRRAFVFMSVDMRFSECRSVFPCSVAVLLAEAGGRRTGLLRRRRGARGRRSGTCGRWQCPARALLLVTTVTLLGRATVWCQSDDGRAVEQAREQHAFDAEVAEEEQVFRVRPDGGGRDGRRARSRASPAGASRPSVTRAVDRRRRRNPGRPERAASARGHNTCGSRVQVLRWKVPAVARWDV